MFRSLIAASLLLFGAVALADNVPNKPTPVEPELPKPLKPDPSPAGVPPTWG